MRTAGTGPDMPRDVKAKLGVPRTRPGVFSTRLSVSNN